MKKMSNEEFKSYLDRCYKDMEQKQKDLFDKYEIGKYDGYWFDQETQSLQFKNRGRVRVEFKIVCIGSWSERSKTWMWGWSNPSFTENIRKDAMPLKELGGITSTPIFESDGFQCDEMMAFETVALAVDHLGGMGMYKISNEKSDLFLALIEEK